MKVKLEDAQKDIIEIHDIIIQNDIILKIHNFFDLFIKNHCDKNIGITSNQSNTYQVINFQVCIRISEL